MVSRLFLTIQNAKFFKESVRSNEQLSFDGVNRTFNIEFFLISLTHTLRYYAAYLSKEKKTLKNILKILPFLLTVNP